MKQLKLAAIDRVDGSLWLPGSKSISNRALLMAALCQGETRITNLLFSDDVNHMLTALERLGIKLVVNKEKREVVVTGGGELIGSGSPVELDLGNAGTAMRPLCAVLAMSQGEFILTGDERMKERPIKHLVDALRSLGASIEYLEESGYPPLHIHGQLPENNQISIDGSLSSQYITALLIASPLMPNGLDIQIEGDLVSKPYIDITIAMMRRFGIHIENRDGRRYRVAAGQSYSSPCQYMVEGDASSASYFLAAAAINGGTVEVRGVGTDSLQGDKRFADVLRDMGAQIEWGKDFIRCTKGDLNGIDMDMNHIPDAAMTIATTALFAKGPSCIRNVYNWRIKETDRLTAMATELKKLGAKVEEGEDYLRIWPLEKPILAAIDTYNDHRMAMCFSMVAVAGFDIIINDPNCVAKTFPDYFEALKAISQ